MAMRMLRLTVLAIATLVLAACAPAAGTPTAPPESGQKPAPPQAQQKAEPQAEVKASAKADKLAALVEAARKEGELVLVGHGSAVGSDEALQRWVDGFNKLYGLNIKVQETPGPADSQVASTLAQEYQAGRPSSTDVFKGADSHIVPLMKAGALASVDWLDWAPNIQNPELLAGDGVAVEIYSRTPGISYNSDRVKGDAVPKTMQDLLKPQYKGRIGSLAAAGSFTRLSSPQIWGKERTLEYVRKFTDQVGGLMRCSENERLLTGEFDLFAIDCGPYMVAQIRSQGGPGGHVIPADAAHVTYQYMAVPKHSRHPNAAKLWINYVLSRQAQDIIYEARFDDHHLVPGTKWGGDLKKMQAAGVKFVEVDVDFTQSIGDEAQITKEIQNIIQKKK